MDGYLDMSSHGLIQKFSHNLKMYMISVCKYVELWNAGFQSLNCHVKYITLIFTFIKDKIQFLIFTFILAYL